jgi:hypothetical protein
MKRFIVPSLCLCFILACSNPPKEKVELDIKTIHQETPAEESILNLSEKYNLLEIIKLESSDTSLVDYVNKVLLDRNRDVIFIKGGITVFKFEMSGNFLSKLSKGKGGPDEFVNLTDVVLLPEQERIWIYDSNKSRIFQFTYDLNLEISYTIGYQLLGIERFKEGIIGTPGYVEILDNFSLFYLSGENFATGYKLTSKKLEFNPEKSRYLHVLRHDFFSQSPEGFNFVNSFNDTIYNINENFYVIPKFYIDFGDKKILEEDLVGQGYSSIVEVFQHINSTEKSFNIGNIVELKDNLLFRFFNQGRSFVSIYDKSKKELKSGRKISFEYQNQQVTFNLDEEITFGSVGNNSAYMIIPAESSVLGEYQTLFQVKDGDNPIILLFDEK